MNSRDYWKRRSLNLEQLLHTRAEKTVAQITALYDKAQENIVGQIEKTFSAYVKGGAMNEQKANQLLTVRETEEARDALREQYRTATGQVKRDIWARLSAPAYANRISRLQALRDDIYAQARRVGLSEAEYVSDRLSDTLEQSYYRTIFDVEQYTGEGYRFDLLGDNQITAALSANWSGKNWSDRLWDNNQRFADAVEETVTVGLLAGLRYDEMRDNLLAVIGLDDTQGAKYNARRLVMTECNYVANQGHLMGYQAAGIEYYIYLATLDLRTSEICRKLDGQRFPVAEATPGTNLPPMHPHCRSTTMCDMSRGQLNRVNRAARDPVTGKSVTIPGYMTYKEWYAKYVEGKTRLKNPAKMVY
ncbi:MAG: minor capsid protein [Clostridiales bacterium]|nr:minor capsid protein [Clostridiales bacterium]